MILPLTSASVFSDGLDHPECVTVHPRDGSIWAGGEAGQIYRIPAEGGSPEEVACTGGFVLGVAVHPDGQWLAACDLKNGCIWRLDLQKMQLREFARGPRIPNHLAFTATGDLFVSDSGAFREVSGKIYRFDSAGSGGVWHPGPFNFANGVALAPDGSALYVVCTWLPGVERIAMHSDGKPGAREVFVRLPATLPDGLAFDADGALLVSCYTPARIWRVPPGGGKPEILIEDWEAHTLSNPTNIALRGRELFAANLGRWHVTRIVLP
ncbi:MAG: SMP-30/gluconolaconase/LRE protein [Verrucomicrobiales bacterium]|nr:SMP-30/gluconolaconase/LRE protein [Verrucomicrobiales bacterium]